MLRRKYLTKQLRLYIQEVESNTSSAKFINPPFHNSVSKLKFRNMTNAQGLLQWLTRISATIYTSIVFAIVLVVRKPCINVKALSLWLSVKCILLFIYFKIHRIVGNACIFIEKTLKASKQKQIINLPVNTSVWLDVLMPVSLKVLSLWLRVKCILLFIYFNIYAIAVNARIFKEKNCENKQTKTKY